MVRRAAVQLIEIVQIPITVHRLQRGLAQFIKLSHYVVHLKIMFAVSYVMLEFVAVALQLLVGFLILI